MSAAAPVAAQALIGMGEVHHARLWPKAHRFSYGAYFLLLPLRSLATQPCAALRRNRRGWLSFNDADHGAGGPDALQWIDELLQAERITDADGEIWLQTLPRVLGHTFKPVSFWYVHRADGRLRAVVAEVNNTFGERHVYVLDDTAMAWGQTVRARKVFHVSPFFRVEGEYAFRFLRTPPAADGGMGRILARVELHGPEGLRLVTSQGGHLLPLDEAHVRHALRHMPLLTLGVVLRIHWQALRLWAKRLPFYRKPEPPTEFATR